jgi:N-acetylglucosamine-6-phosphate deacetylase
MPDGKSLASAIQGMDEGVRQLIAATGEPAWRILRCASLVPARIAGLDGDIGSIESGKRADLLCLDKSFRPLRVWVGGKLILGNC